jgi:hypothetical protein
MPGLWIARRFLFISLTLAVGGTAQARQDLWLTKAHDARRTGQSRINGPLAIDPGRSWTAEAPGAHTLNIGATVTERGVFFGSWGLLRRIPGNSDPRFWDKQDGKLYAVDPSTGAVLASYDPSDDVPEAGGGINSPAIGADGTIYGGVRGRYGNNAVNGHYFAVTYDEEAARFERLWHFEVDGYIEWTHPAIGPDGGLYAGSSSLNDQARTPTYEEGVIPDGTTPLFYALKGPTTPVARDYPPLPPAAFRLDPACCACTSSTCWAAPCECSSRRDGPRDATRSPGTAPTTAADA